MHVAGNRCNSFTSLAALQASSLPAVCVCDRTRPHRSDEPRPPFRFPPSFSRSFLARLARDPIVVLPAAQVAPPIEGSGSIRSCDAIVGWLGQSSATAVGYRRGTNNALHSIQKQTPSTYARNALPMCGGREGGGRSRNTRSSGVPCGPQGVPNTTHIWRLAWIDGAAPS